MISGLCDTCLQERRVRLFDRGDLNTYKDELRFLQTLACNCVSHTGTDSLPASLLQLTDVDRYRSTYRSLLSDISALLTSVTSRSADHTLSQSPLREDLIAVVRQYVAVRWLRRVLIGNSVTTDDLNSVQCCMLDVSKRWFWLHQFVRVL